MKPNTDNLPVNPVKASPEAPHTQVAGEARWTMLCDFDGTISPHDTADLLIEAFGNARCQNLENDWLAGEIGSRACMGGQIGELRASRSELDRLIDDIHIDPGFPGFVDAAEAFGFEVIVVSDGLDYVISRILRRYGLERLPIQANCLTALSGRRWSLSFPFAQADCASGHCKCHQARTAGRRGHRSLLIGDGTSDFCVAARADRVWAKGPLAEHCQQQQIPFELMHDFSQAQAMLSELGLEVNGVEIESDDQRNRIFA